MKRLALALVLALACVCAWGTLPVTTVTFNVEKQGGGFPASVGTAYAKVTQLSNNDPRVPFTVKAGSYNSSTGKITWVLPQSSEVYFKVTDFDIDGTYTLGTSATYTLNTLLAITPSTAPGWAGPLAPLLTVPAKGSMFGSTGTIYGFLAAGTDGYILTADSTQTYGFKWAAAAAEADTLETVVQRGATTSERITVGAVKSSDIYSSPASTANMSTLFGDGLWWEGAADAYEGRLIFPEPLADFALTLPATTGTLALTSDIPTVAGVYLPLAGGTMTGDINSGAYYYRSGTPVTGLSTVLGADSIEAVGTGAGAAHLALKFDRLLYTQAGAPVYTGSFLFAALTASREWTMPNKTGTVAMTSDLPATQTLATVTTAGNTTTNGIEVGTILSGYAGNGGRIAFYSEQGATDYTATLYPNAAMTSNAAFYCPADEPVAESFMSMGTDGIMDYVAQSLYGPLASANTWTANGAVSAPALSGTGTWYSGGTATTTKPYWLMEPAGTTSAAWSTSGTGLGINAATGFVGNLADFQLAGASKFRVSYAGIATATTAFDAASFRLGGIVGLSSSGATLLIGNSVDWTSCVINEVGDDYDTRVEGDTDANLLYVDAGADRVGIGTASPGHKLDVAGVAQATQYRLAALNTAPANATDTGTLGEIRIVADAIYICTATNTWVRAALATW